MLLGFGFLVSLSVYKSDGFEGYLAAKSLERETKTSAISMLNGISVGSSKTSFPLMLLRMKAVCSSFFSGKS